MVEMLMAAFILAVGILGLTILQTMAIRSNTGSGAMTTAVKVGYAMAEQIEAEGRQRLLYARDFRTLPTATTYFGGNTDIVAYYDFKGAKLPDATNSFFNVTVRRSDVVAAVAPAGGVKGFQILVEFAVATDPADSAKTIKRSVTFNRQVAYAV